MKILILGGYGVFGGRLAELLADVPDLDLIIAGRSLSRAEAFCAVYNGSASVKPLRLDRADIYRALVTEKPDLVVDASGPFQAYGENCYHVVEACIANKTDYIDFADAADFVFGVHRFDDEARQAGVFVLSGASSFPVLTAAVLRTIADRMKIEKVAGGIAPSPYAGIGMNVMRAVLSYAGSPVKLVRDGKLTHATGLGESMRFTIAVPGRLPLRNIHFSLVDVPDLQVIPPDHDNLTDIWMGAGPLPEVLHRLLNLLAKARARFKLPSLNGMAPMCHMVLNLLKFGEHRGGMFIRVRGHQDGKPKEISWHLLAEGDDGPYIPSMAIEMIVRKLVAGERPKPGARSASKSLELADYESAFLRKSIVMGFRTEDADAPLYRQILGSAFDELPGPIKTLHDSKASRSWGGSAEVRRGTGVFARLIARLIGFPISSPQGNVRVDFTPGPEGELWTRDFGGRKFSSFQSKGTGRNDGLLVERFGIISVALALVVDGQRLFLVPRRWNILGLPLPKFLLPSGNSFEAEIDGRFSFDVEIVAPLVGLIVAYKGRLEPI